MSRVDNGYRLCVMGDLNGWVVDRVRVGITSAFRVSRENDNGRTVVDFCAEIVYISTLRWLETKTGWR